jgi:hypothetical protein
MIARKRPVARFVKSHDDIVQASYHTKTPEPALRQQCIHYYRTVICENEYFGGAAREGGSAIHLFVAPSHVS